MDNAVASHFGKAAALYQQGRVDEAIRELKFAIELDPRHVKSLTTLGAIYEALERYEEAIDTYRKVLDLEIDDPRANLRLGSVLMRLDRYEDSLTPLRMAWSNDQQNPRAANALACALDETGDTSTAIVMYEEALRLDPNLAEARFNLGILHYNQNRYESAISNFVTYMVKVGENSRAHRNIGRSLERMGQLDGAINSFNKAIKLDPNNPETYFDLGLVYDLKEDYDKAEQYYRNALSILPDYPEARYNLAELLIRVGRPEEAEIEFETILQTQPNNHLALNSLAAQQINRRSYEQAITLLRRAIEGSPDYALAHYNLGIALRSVGDGMQAAEHFHEAARLDPSERPTNALGFRRPTNHGFPQGGSAHVSSRLSYGMSTLKSL